MKECIDFLSQLQQNNNKEWFDAHKTWYREVLSQFEQFVSQLIVHIGAFDEQVKNLNVNQCTYRIYRDTRFSHNKAPYKTYMGAYICQNGKKSGYAGYYFHIEPQVSDQIECMIGRHMLSAGIYMPEHSVLKSIREEICDHGDDFDSVLRKAKNFTLNRDNYLKRIPTGFPPDTPYAEYLKLKDVFIEHYVDDHFITDDHLPERTAELFFHTYPFIQFINRAVAYAYDPQR